MHGRIYFTLLDGTLHFQKGQYHVVMVVSAECQITISPLNIGCNLVAYGSERSVNSVVLISNGLSFAIQAVLFLIIGSVADYGTGRPHVTTAFTLVAWGVSFGWLGVTQPSKWETGTALYIIGLIGYQGALTFWTAAFPGLARDLPEMQESEAQLARGEIEWVWVDELN